MRFSSVFTLSRSFLVGFAAYCCLSVRVCADLTPSQMQNAVFNGVFDALFQWQDTQIFNPGVVNSYPLDDNNASLSFYFSPTGIPEDAYLLSLLDLLDGSDRTLWNYLRTLSNSNLVERRDLASITNALYADGFSVSDLLNDNFTSLLQLLDPDYPGSFGQSLLWSLYDMDGNETPYLAKIRNLTYTRESELRVHDEDLLMELFGIESLLQDIHSSGFGIIEISNVIEGAVSKIIHEWDNGVDDMIDYLDDDPSSTVENARDTVEDEDYEAEESVEDHEDQYTYSVTELQEPNEPQTAPAEDRSGVTRVNLDGDHNMLITLTTGLNSSPNRRSLSSVPILPPMEIDLATTPGVNTFIGNLATIAHVAWDAIFAFLGFLLYFQTFRKIRYMLIAARGDNSVHNFELTFSNMGV